MNKITSLNKVAVRSNRNKIKKFESEKGIVIHHDLRNVLLNYNMAKPQLTYYCKNSFPAEIPLNFLKILENKRIAYGKKRICPHTASKGNIGY